MKYLYLFWRWITRKKPYKFYISTDDQKTWKEVKCHKDFSFDAPVLEIKKDPFEPNTTAN